MPNLNWSNLNNMQLGTYGEYFAKMEFASYGFDVYTSEVDDHGIDFLVKERLGQYFEIQVKSIRMTSSNNYVFMRKDKFNIKQKNLYLMLLLFTEGALPEAYLIPAIAWQNPNELFKDKDYEGLKSKPEYGVNLSKKNKVLLDTFKFEERIGKLSEC